MTERRRELVELLFGFFPAQVLRVAAMLGIADELARGRRTAAELAAATGTRRPALSRFLRALVCFDVVIEPEPDSAGPGSLPRALVGQAAERRPRHPARRRHRHARRTARGGLAAQSPTAPGSRLRRVGRPHLTAHGEPSRLLDGPACGLHLHPAVHQGGERLSAPICAADRSARRSMLDP